MQMSTSVYRIGVIDDIKMIPCISLRSKYFILLIYKIIKYILEFKRRNAHSPRVPIVILFITSLNGWLKTTVESIVK